MTEPTVERPVSIGLLVEDSAHSTTGMEAPLASRIEEVQTRARDGAA